MVATSRASLRVDRLRALNVPVKVTVRTDEQGLPTVVAEDGAVGEDDGRAIEEILEIWRVDDEWWRQPIARRYVDVVLVGGGHVILFEDLITHEWFMQRP